MWSAPVLTLLLSFLYLTLLHAPHCIANEFTKTDTFENSYDVDDNDAVGDKVVNGLIKATTISLSVLQHIATTVDFSRICVIGLANKGKHRLIDPMWYMHHGILHTPLPLVIEPGDAGVFTFEKTQFAPFGTSGMLTYTIAGTNIQVAALWDVPFFRGIEPTLYNVQLYQNAKSTQSWYNKFHGKSGRPFHAVDKTHWMSRSFQNITVRGAMTNKSKASFLIELK